MVCQTRGGVYIIAVNTAVNTADAATATAGACAGAPPLWVWLRVRARKGRAAQVDPIKISLESAYGFSSCS